MMRHTFWILKLYQDIQWSSGGEADMELVAYSVNGIRG